MAVANYEIPAIIFGLALTQGKRRALQIFGWLLLLNGIACILGIIGYASGSDLLSMGTVIGGALFWLAFFPLTAVFSEAKDG